MTATLAQIGTSGRSPARNELAARRRSLLARWWRRQRAERRRINFAVWDLHERYGQAAFGIAQNSALQPIGRAQQKFWRKVAVKLRRLG